MHRFTFVLQSSRICHAAPRLALWLVLLPFCPALRLLLQRSETVPTSLARRPTLLVSCSRIHKAACKPGCQLDLGSFRSNNSCHWPCLTVHLQSQRDLKASYHAVYGQLAAAWTPLLIPASEQKMTEVESYCAHSLLRLAAHICVQASFHMRVRALHSYFPQSGTPLGSATSRVWSCGMFTTMLLIKLSIAWSWGKATECQVLSDFREMIHAVVRQLWAGTGGQSLGCHARHCCSQRLRPGASEHVFVSCNFCTCATRLTMQPVHLVQV